MDSSSSTRITLCAHCGHHFPGDTGVSPIPYLLQNNRPPMPSDFSTIYHAISEAQSDLSDRDRQINQTVAVLDDLRRKQVQDEQYLKKLKGIIHPIRRTPPELLAAIFMLTIPQQWQIASSSQSNNYRKSVLLPGQVCSMWREVSLSTPQLWSNISLNISRNGKRSKAEDALVDTWLSRTGEYPLSIEIFQGASSLVKPLSNALIASSSRWRYLLLSGSLAWLQSGALDGVRHRLSQLQTLVCDTRNNNIIGNLPHRSMNLFAHTPQLHCYHFHSRTPDLPFNLPWTQLTEFSAEQIVLRNCYTTLSKAQNLVTCSISKIESGNVSFPPLCHSQLRFLSIEQHSHSGDLLSHLTLPALVQLQYMEMQTFINHFSESRSVLVAFLSRSVCSLQRLVLKLAPADTTDDHVMRILRLLPSLSELQLMHSVTDKLLSRLTHRTSDSEAVIPRLHTIELARKGNGLSPRLADMIESRWKVGDAATESAQGQVTRLRHVRVSLEQGIEATDSIVRTRLRKLRDEGLDIWLTDKHRTTVGI